MKKMILAATAVGAALAGSLLYARKKTTSSKQIATNNTLPSRSQHAMG